MSSETELDTNEIKRLEELSDSVRMGTPISLSEAIEVIEYQGTLRKKRDNGFWKRLFIWAKERSD